jgi:putative transposase
MPWRVTSPMYQRQRFVLDAEHTPASFAELCRRYDISRKTGYKWLDRYARLGPESLADRSHRPDACPHATAPAVIREILQLRKAWRWGARKLHELLLEAHPAAEVPATATIHRILVRHGRVRRRRRARVRAHPGRPQTPIAGPNVVWSVDFKGQFRLGNGHYCYPLTVQDAYSRYLLACDGLEGPLLQPTQQVFRRLFRTYGLPERMHLTLKRECTRPPRYDRRQQQRCFDRWRQEYNTVRPHEALGDATPASRYTPSPRPYPAQLPPLEYPGHYEVRRVSRNGGIRWHKQWVNVSQTLGEEYVGFVEIDDGEWDVYFGPLRLGRFHERTLLIEDALGRLYRRHD